MFTPSNSLCKALNSQSHSNIFRFYNLQLVLAPNKPKAVYETYIALPMNKIEASINHPNFNQARCLSTITATASHSAGQKYTPLPNMGIDM